MEGNRWDQVRRTGGSLIPSLIAVGVLAAGCAPATTVTRHGTTPGDGDQSAEGVRAPAVSVASTSAADYGEGSCGLGSAYFAYDRSDLDARARAQLADNAQCILARRPSRVTVRGMADPRGTTEYNLALGDRRARSAASFVETRGVSGDTLQPVTVGEELSTGTDEESWARDRRADFDMR